MIVVDASLAVKWRLSEPDSPAALAFLEFREGQLCGPDLLAVEVCRALVTAANGQRIHAARARVAISEWLNAIDRGEIPIYPLDSRLIERGADIALEIGHPLGDCLYLALALDLGAELVTCDAKFAAKARPVYPIVRLLDDYADSNAD